MKKPPTPPPNEPFQDEASDGCRFYPVFCTAEIPVEILNAFIDESRPRHIRDVPSGAWHIATAASTEGVTHGTRTPVAPFRSAFLGMSIPDLYDTVFRPHFSHPRDPATGLRAHNWTNSTFCILDARTAEDRTVLLCCDESGLLECVRADFDMSLYQAVPFEMRATTVALARLKHTDADGVISGAHYDATHDEPLGFIEEYESEQGVRVATLLRRRVDGELYWSGVVRRTGCRDKDGVMQPVEETKWRRTGGDPGAVRDAVALWDDPACMFR